MDAINKRTAEKAELLSDNNVKRPYVIEEGELYLAFGTNENTYILKKIGKKVHGFILIGGLIKQEFPLNTIASLRHTISDIIQVNTMGIIDDRVGINILNSEVHFAYYKSTKKLTVTFINRECNTQLIMHIRGYSGTIFISMCVGKRAFSTHSIFDYYITNISTKFCILSIIYVLSSKFFKDTITMISLSFTRRINYYNIIPNDIVDIISQYCSTL